MIYMETHIKSFIRVGKAVNLYPLIQPWPFILLFLLSAAAFGFPSILAEDVREVGDCMVKKIKDLEEVS